MLETQLRLDFLQEVHSGVDHKKLQGICRELLVAIGEDPDRPGLVDTPRRFADMWREFIDYEPGRTDTSFENVSANQMVVVSDMRVWSLCEHHLLPFWCDISIGYIAREKVLGLSKFARISQQLAHKLQIQEQLIHQIADEVERLLGSPDVAVVGKGEHLCMTMRGVRTPGSMKNSVVRGVFRTNSDARTELLSMIGGLS